VQVVVSRTRYMASELASTGASVRIVGLSASVANAKDLGAWIGATGPAQLFHFHPNVRPVPLEIRIQGFDISHLGARLLAMARPAYASVINTCSSGNPAIIFVPTRKQSQLTAIDMMTYAGADGRPDVFLHRGPDSKAHIEQQLTSAGVTDKALLQTASFGVAYVHEAMPLNERKAVEALYSSGHIGIIIIPVSLVWGLGLTAALVVVMDTVQYDGREHRYIGYPIADMLEIMGRASRPNATSGVCVILCHSSKCVVMVFSSCCATLRVVMLAFSHTRAGRTTSNGSCSIRYLLSRI
jgi:pre-mRNA-splicing helicase BRR2